MHERADDVSPNPRLLVSNRPSTPPHPFAFWNQVFNNNVDLEVEQHLVPLTVRQAEAGVEKVLGKLHVSKHLHVGDLCDQIIMDFQLTCKLQVSLTPR